MWAVYNDPYLWDDESELSKYNLDFFGSNLAQVLNSGIKFVCFEQSPALFSKVAVKKVYRNKQIKIKKKQKQNKAPMR